MNIVIDARLYGPKHTGIGRYTKNLLINLAKLPDFSKNKYTLLVYPELQDEIKADLGSNYSYFSTNLRHYSIKEQIFLPYILYKLNPDLVHFTHLDKPILYLKPSIVTVHDLIRHFSKGSDTTTKNPLLYWPKYFGYLLMSQIIFKTSRLIVPSNYWRNYLINHFQINPMHITTTHEAVDPKFFPISRKYFVKPRPYILYTGNLYPHKNIKVIIEALRFLPDLKLKIICARSVFQQRIEKLIQDYQIHDQVEFLGYVPDDNFKKIYSHALALVHPAFIEGFSLTGLEAMALNCPVIASNTSCLPEIYENSVLFFDPNKPQELVTQLKMLTNDLTLRKKLIHLGHLQVRKYSWTKTALETMAVYRQLLNNA